MSQTVVPAFYSTRKRFKDSTKNVENSRKEKHSEVPPEPEKTVVDNFKKSAQKCSKASKQEKTMVINSKKSVQKSSKVLEPENTVVSNVKKPVQNFSKVQEPENTKIIDGKRPVQKSSKTKTKGKTLNKITNYLKSEPGTSNTNVEKTVLQEKADAPRTPKKRNLTPEEVTPSKKKPLSSLDAVSSQAASPIKSKSSLLSTPQKQTASCKKLLLHSPSRFGSPQKIASPSKIQLTPQKIAAYENLSNKDLASIVEQSRTKILFSGRLEELKKSLESFTNVSAKTKEFQANSYKITSVVSSAKSSEKEPVPVIKGEPAYKKFSYLAAPKADTSFVLPYKYKLLGETFRCLDTVVRMIYNRKEKVTFEKVKQGVQDMMKKNFLMNHLGQILPVFPTAYSLEYEKRDSYSVNKKSSSSYQLIITPNLSEGNGSLSDVPEKDKNQRCSFIYMTPQHLLERKHVFEQNLLKITKTHHQEFLKRKNFPAVPDDKIVRWHPEFPVDSVPNIPIGALPEEPELKVCTAKDVLNKLKGSVRGRVGKALQSVADERKSETSETEAPDLSTTKNKKQSSALKGICNDLLEKIRARESAKILETMTRSTQDEKRLQMLERLPKIVHILWHYFIAERKAAVPVDVAVEKIIHSFNSLSTPDAVKEHLDLIRETMPGWLSLIKISKGEYLTIDKKKDINVMLSNLK